MGNITLKKDMEGDWEEAVLQSMTVEMVEQLAEKGAVALELFDDILQPETQDFLRRLPEASESLSRLLDSAQQLEKSGALKNLAEIIELMAQLKNIWTGSMVTEAVEKAGKALEATDDLVQKGFPKLAAGILTAVESACKESGEQHEPVSLFQLLRMLSDPEVREGIRFLLSFAKVLPKVLKNDFS